MTTPTFRFRNDGPMRKKLFVAEAMAHPAKRRDPAAFDNRLMFEEVLAFRKPEQ